MGTRTWIRRGVLRLTDPIGFAQQQEELQLERMIGFPGQYAAHRKFQMAFLEARGLTPGHRVLEIGCGSLTLGVPLIAFLEPGHYCGIDVRPRVLDAAYHLIAKQGLAAKNARLICSSTFGRDELADERYSFVVAFSVLYHLEDPLVDGFFAEAARRMAPGGVTVANVNVEHEPSRWLEFPFVQRPVRFYEERARHAGLTTEVLGQGADLGMSTSDLASRNYYLAFRRANAA